MTQKSIRFEELNTKSFLEAGFKTAIVPFGSCESHGDHLPFGTDGIVAHKLALLVAERLGDAMVLPPTFFGMSHHYRHKPMTVSLSNDTTIRLFRDVLESLAYWEIETILIINGHDGNIPCIEIAARDTKLAHPNLRIVALDAWWITAGNLLPKDTFQEWGGLGHGGEGETSIGLALMPELVDMDNARGMIPATDSNVKEIWDFSELTNYGATGAPHLATTEKGEKMRDALVDYLVEYMNKRDAKGWSFEPREL